MSDIIQQSFAGGEITPALQSREDLAKQQVSVSTLRNMIVTSTGALVSRGGLLQIDEVEDMSDETRLMPFIFSTTQAYGLVWGDTTLMIIKDGVLVLRNLTDGTYEWTESVAQPGEYHLEISGGGNPLVLEPHKLYENDVSLPIGAIGALTAGSWNWGDNDGIGYSVPYVRLTDTTDPDGKASGYVEIPYMIVTPWNSGPQNDNIDSAQSADVMYIANKVTMPYELIRLADNSWTLILSDLQDGPYLKLGDDDEDISMTPSAKTGSVTITSNVDIPNSPTVGQPWRMGYINPLDGSIIEWGWGTITAVPTSKTLTVTVVKDFGYENLLNPEFAEGIGFWEDRSTGVSTLTFDSTNKLMVLTKGASGETTASQTVSVNTYEKLTIEIDVHTIVDNMQVQIGTTLGGADVLSAQTMVAATTYSYTTAASEPNTSPIYITINTVTGAQGVNKISRVSLMRADLATNHWRLGAWDSDKGYPERVALFEQSIWYGNNSDQPDTFWKGKIGDYVGFPFNTPPLDTDGLSATLASERVNAIQAIVPYGQLVMFSTGSEWRISPSSGTDSITPTSISAKAKSNTGSGVISSGNNGTPSIKPIKVKNSLLFIRQGTDGSDKKFCNVYVLGYSLDADAYSPVDLTVLAPHLFENHTIKQWAYQESPYSVIWCVRDDGVLLGLTYIEDQEIWAWHVHETTGKFESVMVVPEDGEDVVYFIIRRVFNNVERRYIERLMPYTNDEDIYDWFTVDSGVTLDIESDIASLKSVTGVVFLGTDVYITYGAGATTISDDDYIYISNIVGTTEINKKTFRVDSHQTNPWGAGWAFRLYDKEGDGAIDGTQYTAWVSGGDIRKGTSTVSGLDHLNGQTVSVLADGSYKSKLVQALVGGGYGYELDQPEDIPAIVIHSGLPYNQDLKTLPHERETQEGTSQGKNKILKKANIYFNKSGNAEVGADEDNLSTISFTNNDSGNNPPSLVTGVKEITVKGSRHSKLTQTFIRNNKPFPMGIAGIISDVNFKEK